MKLKYMTYKTALILALFVPSIFLHASDAGAKIDASMRGKVMLDGSSTVFPISEAVAEEFRNFFPRVRVTVGVSGTGGGFKKFLVGEVDINDASRPIKKKEVDLATKNQIEYQEIPVAYDGISVVVNPKNTWVDQLTVDELRRIWNNKSTITTWQHIRPEWPNKPIKLYGPGTDSGTFDYFTDAINGKSGNSRSDYTMSEDDNVLVKGVSGDRYALAYFGFSYYVENKTQLKAVPIKAAKGPAVLPSQKTINNGTYAPLSRPIFIYVSLKAAKRREVQEFVRFYINQAPTLSKEVGYVPLPQGKYKSALRQFNLSVNK